MPKNKSKVSRKNADMALDIERLEARVRALEAKIYEQTKTNDYDYNGPRCTVICNGQIVY